MKIFIFSEVRKIDQRSEVNQCFQRYSLIKTLHKKNDQVYSNRRVPTQVNTSQHESTQVNTSPTRVNTSLTRVNTSPTRVNTNQHESKTGPDKILLKM